MRTSSHLFVGGPAHGQVISVPGQWSDIGYLPAETVPVPYPVAIELDGGPGIERKTAHYKRSRAVSTLPQTRSTWVYRHENATTEDLIDAIRIARESGWKP